ncbi:MAG: phosphoribosylformylglycinamidine synthase subunit PurS [Chloroflexi bacterium]|nr:phosphoribosylformylglycinamidine synthase subunit PurS [Chloroflexota bacterium]
MAKWLANIRVTLKPVVNDPQGLSIRDALHNLGYTGVEAVRSGKFIQLFLTADSAEAAEIMVDAMCRSLLANPVIEDYSAELLPTEGREGSSYAKAH